MGWRRRAATPSSLQRWTLGLASGLVAGWMMNRAEAGLARVGSEASKRREAAASRAAGEPPTQKVASFAAGLLGYRLTRDQKKVGANVVHYATAAMWGGAFGLLPQRLRRPALVAGLGGGLVLWLLEDEWLLTKLRLAPPPSAYPLSSHLKGLAAHLVWGASTAGAHRILEGAARS